MFRPCRSAFTLVELLVVVAIIALLIAILLPALGRARGLVELTACGSNLRQLAVAGSSHATDRKGWFPQTMRNNPMSQYGAYGQLRHWRIDGTNPDDDRWYGDTKNYFQWHRGNEPGYAELITAWKHYGTPWEVWNGELGVTVGLLICPGSETEGLGEEEMIAGSRSYKAGYGWVSGAQHAFNWGHGYPRVSGMRRRIPPLTNDEHRLSERPLAVDIVRLGGRPLGVWASQNEVNHGVVPYVEAQNIAFADGHVEKETAFYGDNRLDEIYPHQWNRNSDGSNDLRLWFWGTGE